jgi:O-antigen ligase
MDDRGRLQPRDVAAGALTEVPPLSTTETPPGPPAPPRPAAPEEASKSAAAVEAGLLALLVLSPLPAGSVYDEAVLAIQLLVFLLAAIHLCGPRPVINSHLAARSVWPRRFLTILAGVLALQVLPLPRALVALLSPRAAGLRTELVAGSAGASTATLSLAPFHTARSALELLAYVLIGILVARTFLHRRQIQRLLLILTAAGAFQAFYGLFELFRAHPRILFFPKIYNLSSATGTFVNRNHYSGYLEMILPLALGLLIARLDLFSLSGQTRAEKAAQLTGRGLAGNVFILIAAAVMILAIVRSQSRSGVFVLLFIFVLFFELTVFHFSARRYRQAWVKTFIKAAFVVLTLVILYAGVESTMGRFAKDNLLQDGRPQYWSNTLSIVRDFPLFGTGLGTFGDVYPAYGTARLEGRLTHAHNDYLEFLSELGLAGFAPFLATILFLIIDGFRTWTRRRYPRIKALGLGGFISLAAILVHSLTDFNLHVPANALLFSAILGLTFATAYYRKV